jgi:hypothetical protein
LTVPPDVQFFSDPAESYTCPTFPDLKKRAVPEPVVAEAKIIWYGLKNFST